MNSKQRISTSRSTSAAPRTPNWYIPGFPTNISKNEDQIPSIATKFLVIKLSLYMFRPMMAITKTRRTEHNKLPSTHTQDKTQWNMNITETPSNILKNWKIFINFNKSIFIILSTGVTHT
jgi:hypothetical protein